MDAVCVTKPKYWCGFYLQLPKCRKIVGKFPFNVKNSMKFATKKKITKTLSALEDDDACSCMQISNLCKIRKSGLRITSMEINCYFFVCMSESLPISLSLVLTISLCLILEVLSNAF